MHDNRRLLEDRLEVVEQRIQNIRDLLDRCEDFWGKPDVAFIVSEPPLRGATAPSQIATAANELFWVEEFIRRQMTEAGVD